MSSAPDRHRSRQSSLGIWGGWRSSFRVPAVLLVLTGIVAHHAEAWLAPPRGLSEVKDAVRDLRAGAPGH